MPFVKKSQALSRGKLKKGCKRVKTKTGTRYSCATGRRKTTKKGTKKRGTKGLAKGAGCRLVSEGPPRRYSCPGLDLDGLKGLTQALKGRRKKPTKGRRRTLRGGLPAGTRSRSRKRR